MMAPRAGMADDDIRHFRDPIHGFIKVYTHEKAIIDTFPFQRLRRISQLGLTSHVYHGAEHSRFGHSLGVMHLAGEATKVLLEKHPELLRESAGWTAAEFDDRREGVILM